MIEEEGAVVVSEPGSVVNDEVVDFGEIGRVERGSIRTVKLSASLLNEISRVPLVVAIEQENPGYGVL